MSLDRRSFNTLLAGLPLTATGRWHRWPRSSDRPRTGPQAPP